MAYKKEPLKIAICGGGISSVCLAHALYKHPDLQVKIFEASTELREDGAAIGLGQNAQEALALASPALREALDEAGGTRMDPALRIMMGTGADSGQHVGDVHLAVSQIVVHRGRFLRALRKRIPDNVLELGKRLVNVEPLSELVRIGFEDGTFYEADALVGCDGINSITRKAVLGADHSAASPVMTGGYNHRVVVPLETAIAAFGHEYCSFRTQYGWVGDRGFLLTDLVDNGTAMQVIAGWSRDEPWPYKAPFIEWSKDKIKEDFQYWGDVGKAMTKIFVDQPKLYAAGGRVHLDTPTYCNGRMCIAGDAAQSFPPFQGAGAGQAVEDALILSTVLGACHGREDVARAFKIYDAVRRPRRSDIARSSKWAAMLLTGRLPGVGLNMDLLAENLKDWGSNIYSYDVGEAQEDAIERMRHE